MAAVVDVFQRDDDVALVMADISLDYLRPAVAHDPRRAINVGIMEQSAVGVAAGFALEATTRSCTRSRRSSRSGRSSRSSSTSATRASAASSSRPERRTTTRVGRDASCGRRRAGARSIPRIEVLVPGSPAETGRSCGRRTRTAGRPTCDERRRKRRARRARAGRPDRRPPRRRRDRDRGRPVPLAHARRARRDRRDRALCDHARAARRRALAREAAPAAESCSSSRSTKGRRRARSLRHSLTARRGCSRSASRAAS